jgi:hypothetical protein
MGNKNGHFCKFLSRSGSGFSRQKFFLTIHGNNPIYFNRLKACGQYFPGMRVKIEKGKANYPVIRYRYNPRINKVDKQGVAIAESSTITTPGKSILFKI